MKLGLVITITRFLQCLKLLFNRKNPSFSFIEIIKIWSLKISKMIIRKPYRATRAHMMHLTTISPPALINMLRKRKRSSGKWKASHEHLRWAIMKRLKLKNKANKTETWEDFNKNLKRMRVYFWNFDALCKQVFCKRRILRLFKTN